MTIELLTDGTVRRSVDELRLRLTVGGSDLGCVVYNINLGVS